MTFRLVFNKEKTTEITIDKSIEYDVFGRESRKSLPVYLQKNNGAYVSNETISKFAANQYNDNAAYSQTVYENSPLNRVLKQYGPGQDWHDNNKAVSTDYLSNKGTSGLYACAKFKVTGTGTATKLTRSGHYSDGMLSVIQTKDEDDNVSFEFKDKLGQVILTRQVNSGQNHDTYYVYDIFGNLSYVLPPLASDNLADLTDAGAMMKNYAYIYKYDKYQRCISKKLPGCEPIYYVYDKADQLILSQDGEQRANSQWAFNAYDKLGRVIYSGIHKDHYGPSAGRTHSYLINQFKDLVIQETSGWFYGYSLLLFNQLGAVPYNYKRCNGIANEVLLVNYYDSYWYVGRGEFADIKVVEAQPTGFTGKEYSSAKGLLTGTLVYYNEERGNTNLCNHDLKSIATVIRYDNRGRVIQTKSTNHLGGVDKEFVDYNFTGQPTKKKHIHSATGKTTLTEDYAYSYDHAGRLLKTTHKLNGGTEMILAENTYDELGRLKEKKSNNNNDALKTTYTYNVRSWLKTIGGRFTEQLYYNEALNSPDGSFTNKKSYTGNISAKHSGHWDSADRYYFFTYDNLSRLLSADYSENSRQTGSTVLSSGRYSNSYTYDKQGNILTLERGGIKWQGAYGIIDDLTYEYTGNQLKRITDTGEKTQRIESEDFKDYADLPVEYAFNANGAMSKDLNKGISDIQYNSLNLPRQMDIKSPFAEARNEYLYSASGVKLHVTHRWNSDYSKTPIIGSTVNTAALDMTKVTDYIGNKVYEQGVLKKILVDGGYIEDGKYYFTLQDHLGNTRMVLSQDGSIVQREYYYPFGMTVPHIEYDGKHPYRYNGKELDQMHRLDLYDYSARYYDQAIGRFTTVDPHAENYYSWSPYHYAANNPIRVTDPTGMDWVTDKDQNITWNDKATSVKNTPVGYTYIGDDQALLSHLGMSYSFEELSTNRVGMVAFDESVGMHLINVKEKSNVTIGINSSFNKDKETESNALGITYNGVKVTITNSTRTTGSDGDINSSSSVAKVEYGGKTYSRGMQEPSGTNIYQIGSSITQAIITIPANQINSSNNLSSISVSGSWWVTKPEGRTPVVYHGLIPVPQTYKFTWTFSKK